MTDEELAKDLRAWADFVEDDRMSPSAGTELRNAADRLAKLAAVLEAAEAIAMLQPAANATTQAKADKYARLYEAIQRARQP